MRLAMVPPGSVGRGDDRRADDELRGQQVRSRGAVDACELVEHERGGKRADLVHRLVNGRQRRLDIRGYRKVVVTDDRDVLRHTAAGLAELPDRPECDQVAVREQRREVAAALDQPGGGSTPTLEPPVGGLLDERGVLLYAGLAQSPS